MTDTKKPAEQDEELDGLRTNVVNTKVLVSFLKKYKTRIIQLEHDNASNKTLLALVGKALEEMKLHLSDLDSEIYSSDEEDVDNDDGTEVTSFQNCDNCRSLCLSYRESTKTSERTCVHVNGAYHDIYNLDWKNKACKVFYSKNQHYGYRDHDYLFNDRRSVKESYSDPYATVVAFDLSDSVRKASGKSLPVSNETKGVK